MLGSGDESRRAALGLRAGAPAARPRARVSRCSVCARSVVRRSGTSWPGAAPSAMGFSAGRLALPDTTRATMDGPRAAVPAVELGGGLHHRGARRIGGREIAGGRSVRRGLRPLGQRAGRCRRGVRLVVGGRGRVPLRVVVRLRIGVRLGVGGGVGLRLRVGRGVGLRLRLGGRAGLGLRLRARREGRAAVAVAGRPGGRAGGSAGGAGCGCGSAEGAGCGCESVAGVAP